MNRYRESDNDLDAVEERSRRPLTSPNAIDPELEDAIVAARKRYPKWGPRKLHARLVERNPEVWIPSPSDREGAQASRDDNHAAATTTTSRGARCQGAVPRLR